MKSRLHQPQPCTSMEKVRDAVLGVGRGEGGVVGVGRLHDGVGPVLARLELLALLAAVHVEAAQKELPRAGGEGAPGALHRTILPGLDVTALELRTCSLSVNSW